VHELLQFSGNDQPALLERCQRLRYEVYHRDLGLDTPDLDHVRHLDIEERDASCDFAAVVDRANDDEILGCIRMQSPKAPCPFYAELEFDLLGPTWPPSIPCIEGARFAVTSAERNGSVPLLLFQAFRRYCRTHAIGHVLSVAIIKGNRDDRGLLARLTRFLVERTHVAFDRGRPARGYELAPPTAEELANAGALGDDEGSPMLRLLANARTTLSSPPAYCSRFGTFNFLLTTRIG